MKTDLILSRLHLHEGAACERATLGQHHTSYSALTIVRSQRWGLIIPGDQGGEVNLSCVSTRDLALDPDVRGLPP